MSKKIKIGVFGARRGAGLAGILSRHPDAELAALCDQDAAPLERARQLAGQFGCEPACYAGFDAFMNHDMDAVVLANYATEHAPYAIRLLESGRHVCSELLACQTLAEAVALVEAVERSGRVYTFAENCCYFTSALEMRRLYRRGDIGEFLHGEGQYIHDCEAIWTDLTRGQRDHWRNWAPSTFYCSHSLGPLCTITGARPTRLSAYETPNANKRRFGCRSADGAVMACQMSNGATASILPWVNYKREPGMEWYAIYGTRGMLETDRWGETYNRMHVYVEGDAEAASQRAYAPRPPLTTELSRTVGAHGGADFFTLHYFLEAILDRPGREDAVDVYQAMDMSLPGLLGYRSIWEGNVPLEVPDLRDKAARERYRHDDWSADPRLAGPGQPALSCARGPVEVPDSVYRRQAGVE